MHVRPLPASVGGSRPVSAGSWLSLQRVPPTCGSKGCLGGVESAAKRDRDRVLPWGAPPSVGTEGETLCLLGGGMKRGGLGGSREVTMSFGAAVSPGEALPWQRGRWVVDGGGHSPQMPENSWMGRLKNSKNCRIWVWGVWNREKDLIFTYIENQYCFIDI